MSQISLIAKSELRSLIQVFAEPAHQNTLKQYARRLEIYASPGAGNVCQLNFRESITAQTTHQICLPERREKEKKVLEAYRKHVAERAKFGVVPKPLSAEQVAGLIELLKQPPAGEENFLLELLSHRVPPGVDEAAYLKAGFLSALAKGEANSPSLIVSMRSNYSAPC